MEELRKFRNLVAHFAVRRFPDDDAFLFVAKSRRDFKRVFGADPPPGAALTSVADCAQVRNALKHVEHVQNWLAHATANLERPLDRSVRTVFIGSEQRNDRRSIEGMGEQGRVRNRKA